MSTASIQPVTLQRGLASLRRAMAKWFMLDALARVCVAALLMTFLSLGLDRTFGMDRPQRAIVLMLMLAVLGWILWSRLIRPLIRTPDDDAMCRIVESRHAVIADTMSNALQLARLEDSRQLGASAQLVRAAVNIGELHAAELNFLDVLNRREQQRNLWRGGASLAALALAFAVFYPTMSLWAQRNILLASTPWPQRTHLRVTGLDETGTLIVPRGDDLVLRVRAAGVVPQMVHLDVRTAATGPARTQEMVGVGNPGAANFETGFPNVLDPFSFRVRGGDAVTDWHTVRLVDRPQLQTLELHVTPPAYTQLEPRILSTGRSVYEAPAGSTLVVSGMANKPLASVQLLLEDEHVADPAVDPGSPQRFAVALGPRQLQSGAYGLSFVDRHDLHSRRPARFVVRVEADDPPMVRAELSGIGDMITPRARIPLHLRCSDDYAVTRADVIVEYAPPGESDATRRRLPLPTLAASLPALDAGPADELIDLQPLELPIDATLGLSVEVTDNDAVSGPKTSAGAVFAFKVVTEEQLRDELLRRETEQRMEFERLLADQRQLHTDTLAFIAGLVDADRLSAVQWRELSDLEKTQRLAAGRCAGIAQEFTRILAEVINNRLEDSEPGVPQLQTRLSERVITPLNGLADDALPAAAEAIEAVRRTDIDAEARRAGLTRAADVQRQIIQAMELVLANMVRMEGYQEAINQLRRIIGAQEDVEERTIKALEKRIEDIFGP